MTKSNTTPERVVINALTEEVALEREAQIAQWGTQDHPSLWGETDRRSFERTSKFWHEVNDARVQLDSLSWDGILLEEVFEALSEIDPLLRRMELIQVAAVALAEVECIDRAIEAGVYEGFAPECVETDEPCALDCETASECTATDPSSED